MSTLKKKRTWNGHGVAADPSKRGTKGHSIIDEVPGLGDWLIEQCMQSPRPTLTAIMDRLKGTKFLQKLEDLGHEGGLSRTTLGDFIQNWKQFAIEQALERAKRTVAITNARSYNESNDDEELFEVDSQLGTMVTIDVSERLQQARAQGQPIGEDLREDLKVAARFQTAKTMRARARFMITRGIRRVESRVEKNAIARIVPLLQKKHPEILPFVREVIKTAVREAVNEELKRE